MSYNPTLETKRLILRKISGDDKEDLFELLTNSEMDKKMIWNHLDDMDEIEAYITEVRDSYNMNHPSCFGIELKEDNHLIGVVEFFNYKEEFNCVEMHYMLLPKHHRKGMMTEALLKILSFIFDKTDINRIEAFCLKENKAAAKVLEKAGLILEGILREKILVGDEYMDIKLYSMLKSDMQFVVV
ncbi:MAG: GNAT family N-acetyltransferase [Candidatus Cloacimonetes bacterium]|nr:GNAT family N-acetyltransferase [Candidatus Cloacimonadota bacterium]MCF7813417.1 GNAT family N-acetyltransferase [Candidatus Cloacimonadota bacterium]MCF7867710.1 GNAT family N-acetyltransferase [Candidatus Cloacimonadota bacterium]MCF7883204.1 GNAT family N-acetyltransferase [Candidatus Cloacimonadota bacterium]